MGRGHHAYAGTCAIMATFMLLLLLPLARTQNDTLVPSATPAAADANMTGIPSAATLDPLPTPSPMESVVPTPSAAPSCSERRVSMLEGRRNLVPGMLVRSQNSTDLGIDMEAAVNFVTPPLDGNASILNLALLFSPSVCMVRSSDLVGEPRNYSVRLYDDQYVLIQAWSLGDMGNATNVTAPPPCNFSSSGSMEVAVPPVYELPLLAPLASMRSYWLSLQLLAPVQQNTSTQTQTGFYWYIDSNLGNGTNASSTSASVFRDLTNRYGQGWTNWTTLRGYESTFLAPAKTATSADRFAAALELGGCWPRNDTGAIPPDDNVHAPVAVGLDKLILIGIIAGSTVACLIILIVAIFLVRRFRTRMRHLTGNMAWNEMMYTGHGSALFVPPSASSDMEEDTTDGASTQRQRGADVSVLLSSSRSSESSPSSSPRGTRKPFVNSEGVFNQVSLERSHSTSSSGNRSPRLISGTGKAQGPNVIHVTAAVDPDILPISDDV